MMKSIKLHETYSVYKNGVLELKTTDLVHLDIYMMSNQGCEVKITWEVKNEKRRKNYAG